MHHMASKRPTHQKFGEALRICRAASGLTQEDFGQISSRTYVSTLERGLKSPTLEKIDDLAETMGIHPLVLLIPTYLDASDTRDLEKKLAELIEVISEQLKKA